MSYKMKTIVPADLISTAVNEESTCVNKSLLTWGLLKKSFYFAESWEQLKSLLKDLNTERKKFRIKVNEKKTKFMAVK